MSPLDEMHSPEEHCITFHVSPYLRKDSIVSVASIRRLVNKVMEDPAEAGLSLGFIRLAGTDLPVPSVLMYIPVAVSDFLFSTCVTANRVFGLSS